MKLVTWAVVTLSLVALPVAQGAGRLIGGQEVPATAHGGAIVRLQKDGASCSATIVGPKALITAGHCAAFSSTASFTSGGQTYNVQLYYPSQYDENFDYAFSSTGLDYDISLGEIDREVVGVTPISVAGTAQVGGTVTLLGYGCTSATESGGNNGTLKEGQNLVRTVLGNGMVLAGMQDGASGCPGDSGGPGLVQDSAGNFTLLGVADQVAQNQDNSLKPETWEVMTTAPDIQQFLQTTATQKQIQVCGLNLDCPAHGS